MWRRRLEDTLSRKMGKCIKIPQMHFKSDLNINQELSPSLISFTFPNPTPALQPLMNMGCALLQNTQLDSGLGSVGWLQTQQSPYNNAEKRPQQPGSRGRPVPFQQKRDHLRGGIRPLQSRSDQDNNTRKRKRVSISAWKSNLPSESHNYVKYVYPYFYIKYTTLNMKCSIYYKGIHSLTLKTTSQEKSGILTPLVVTFPFCTFCVY